MTRYEYDDAGRLVSSRPESEWDETQQGWMTALAQHRRDNLCPLCGMPKEICQAPYGTWVYSTGDPVRCNITTAIRNAQKAHGDTEAADALIWSPKVVPWGMSIG